MSKLAHSNQETMDEMDVERAIENGDVDLLPKLERYWLDLRSKCLHLHPIDYSTIRQALREALADTP